MANSGANTVTKLRGADGATLGTYTVGNIPQNLAFDGANMWITTLQGSGTVAKLRTADGALLGTYLAQNPLPIAFDGASIWVATYGGLSQVYKF